MKAHLTAGLARWALINAHHRHKIEQQKIEFLWIEIAKKLPPAHMHTCTRTQLHLHMHAYVTVVYCRLVVIKIKWVFLKCEWEYSLLDIRRAKVAQMWDYFSDYSSRLFIYLFFFFCAQILSIARKRDARWGEVV